MFDGRSSLNFGLNSNSCNVEFHNGRRIGSFDFRLNNKRCEENRTLRWVAKVLCTIITITKNDHKNDGLYALVV